MATQKPDEAIDFNAVKKAIKVINDNEEFVEALGGEKIKVIGKGLNKSVVIASFRDAVLALDKADLEIPEEVVVPTYNDLYYAEGEEPDPDAEPEETPKKEKKETKKTEPKDRKPPQRTSESIARRKCLRDLIAEGTHTKEEIWEAFNKVHPTTAKSTVMTYISDGKNPKYNVFKEDGLVDISDEGIVSFANGK